MRIPHLLAAACILAAVPAAAQNAGPDAAVVVAAEAEAEAPDEQPTLADLLWIARPIVVFADTPNDPRFVQQMQMLDQQPGDLVDRAVVILTDTDPAERGPLRLELRPRGFGLVLIDLDGSIVQRRPAPTTAREIINLIDRLPSRRQETGSRRQ
jgi:hypothetical protein